MKALRIELYQDHVCYRQETGYRFFQTYPLPTPSMVRGLVHRLMGATEYIPLKISIQGMYDSIFIDMQRWDSETKKRMGAPEAGSHTLMFWEELANVRLLLHIAFKNDNEVNLEKLKNAFIGNTVVLGRNEDIARIDSINIMELQEAEEDVNPKYFIYASKYKNKKYPVFHLPFAYKIEKTQRIFKYVDVSLVDKNSPVDTAYCYGDKNEAICFLELSESDEQYISQK